MNYKNILIGVIILFLGFFIGWLVFSSKMESSDKHVHSEEQKTSIWTCSMHPQIRMNEPGKCPICAMDLIPLNSESTTDATNIQMSESAMKLAEIQTIEVKKGNPIKELFLQGKIHADERQMSEIAARFDGRIEKLFVNYTGQLVKEGELLAKIYSPELVTAQKELLEAVKSKSTNPAMYKAAINKLKLWSITDEQIANIEQKDSVEMYYNIVSPISGTVSMRQIELGNYVKKGSTLFKIIDLNNLWVMFDAYEKDLPWIKLEDKVNFEILAIPGEMFSGNIDYIDPFINPKTRIAKIRLNLKNKNNMIKPEMFVRGYIKSDISINGDEIVIPKSAVLWTGKRSIVYVRDTKAESPSFKYRDVVLGPDAGSSYIVKKGLKEGEIIAINGVFKIDAASQLAGYSSMMNPKNKDYVETNSEFKTQLTNFYKDYLKFKNALIDSDYKKASEISHLLNKSLKKIDMELLKDKAHMSWMNINKNIKIRISNIEKAKDLDSQKKEFVILSELIYDAVKTFGLNDVSYYHFCPMANDGKGAYWLSESEEVRNPYFGKEMLECGDMKEVIE